MITSVNVLQAMVKLVSVDALKALQSQLIMGNLVVGVHERIPSWEIQFPVGEGNASVRLDQHISDVFKIPDVTKVLAVPELLGLYMLPAVGRIAEQIELDLLNFFPALLPNGQPNTEARLAIAEQTLAVGGVPLGSHKYAVVSPGFYVDIRASKRFEESLKLRACLEGPVGRIGDMFIVRSEVLNAGAVAFHRDGLALAFRRPEAARVQDLSACAENSRLGIQVTSRPSHGSLSQDYTIEVVYGAGVLRKSFGVRV